MLGAKISLHDLSDERPPAVVLGDLTLVRPHGMAGIPVILATTDPGDIALHSRYVTGSCILPGLDEANRVQSAEILLALGAKLHRALGRKVPLAYGSDKHLELIYRHRRELGRHYLFVLNEEDLCWSLLDKERFYPLAEAAGLRVPRTLDPGQDARAALAALREPILVKPRRKAAWAEMQRSLFGGKGKARVFATRAELLAHPAFERFQGDLIVQEYIEGGAGDLLSFHGFADAEGRLLASFCGRKVRTYPAFAGESSYIEIAAAPEVSAAGRVIAARLGLRGPLKVDLLRDARSGELYTLEINARYTLWHYLGAAAGLNLPAVIYEHLVNGRAPAAARPCEPSYRWLNLYRDYQAFQERRATGQLAAGAWLRSIARGNVVYEAFAWDDPEPFARWAGDLIVRKVAHGALRDRL